MCHGMRTVAKALVTGGDQVTLQEYEIALDAGMIKCSSRMRIGSDGNLVQERGWKEGRGWETDSRSWRYLLLGSLSPNNKISIIGDSVLAHKIALVGKHSERENLYHDNFGKHD